MAARSQAEVLALIQALEDVYADEVTDAGGMDTLLSALETQCVTGDHEEENIELLAAIKAVRDARNGVMKAILEKFAGPIGKVLGRFASSPNLADLEVNLAYFQKWLIDNADEFEERGFTKASTFTAGGSNVGTAQVLVHNIDPAYGGDVGHVETKTVVCTKPYPEAPTEGNEEYEVRSTAPGDYAYLEGGSGDGNTYKQEYGKAAQGLSAEQEVISTNEPFNSVCGDEASGNVINDGDFENTTLTDEWTVSNAGWAIDSTDECIGAQSVKTEEDTVMYQYIGARMHQLCIYGADYIAKKTSTPTGTLTIKIKDDSTTHLTLTKDVSTLTTSAVKQAFGTFVLPANADMSTLRVELEMATYGSSGKVIVDEVCLQMLKVCDGGQAFGVTGGVTPAAKHDVYTNAVTGGTSGDNMELLNRMFKRGFESDTAATDWADN